MDCPKHGTDYLPLFKYLHLKIQTDGLEVPYFFLYHFLLTWQQNSGVFLRDGTPELSFLQEDLGTMNVLAY